jgi:peptide/nickel transport system substrate-binding protein
LCPLIANDLGAYSILSNVSQTLLGVDYKTYQITPILAEERPKIDYLPNGKMTISVAIRKEAAWDDGSPVTAEDVAFSLKALRCPKIDNSGLNGEFQDIEDIVIDAQNPKKFTLLYKEAYYIAEESLSDLWILPHAAYDKDNLLGSYTLMRMKNTSAEVLLNDPKLTQFAEHFNSPKFQRETIMGSGAYKFVSWQTQKRITLVRKKDWWGDKVASKIDAYWVQAYPKQLVYETINDMTTAVVALKGGKVDVMANVVSKDYVDLQKSPEFTGQFNMFTPLQPTFAYIGINMRNPKLSDIRVRQALAHLMDVDTYIQTMCYGMAVRATSMIVPGSDTYKNPAIQPYSFDIDLSQKLLEAAGWKDTNKNGTLDKIINGKLTELELKVNYNIGNKKREKVCLIFQEACKKVGVKIDIAPMEWSKMLENLNTQNFDLYVNASTKSSVGQPDPTQMWHTQSAEKGGSNYMGFGDASSDAIIMQLRIERDPDKRLKLFYTLQEKIAEQVPCIFLTNAKNTLVVNKRYSNIYESINPPGYWAAGFGK